MNRLFPTSNGKQTITCRCGRTDATGHGGGRAGGHLPPEATARFFAQRGWQVGATPRKDRCPDCANPKPKLKERKAPTMAVPQDKVVSISPAAAQPPRKLEREQRRIIFLKLEEVYLGDTIGYSPGWNDERIASELNYPRAWIEEVRDLNFGPQFADKSADIQRINSIIRAAEDETKAANVAIDRLHETMRNVERGLSEAAAKTTAAMLQIEKARGDMRKLTGRA